jgi:hypothetical protein
LTGGGPGRAPITESLRPSAALARLMSGTIAKWNALIRRGAIPRQ